MKDSLKQLSTQKRPVIKLAHRITWAMAQGQESIHRPELSKSEKQWLKENGFEYSYEQKIHEHRIIL